MGNRGGDVANRSGSRTGGTVEPSALIHRRILDVADEEPRATIEDIADRVSGASPTYVERVLDEYGDPADDSGSDEEPDTPTAETAEAGDGDAGESSDRGTADPDLSELSDKQYETLVAVADRPDATQAEIAERLGVGRAAVAKRLNDIPGFDWASRESFVRETLPFRGDGGGGDGGVPQNGDSGGLLGNGDSGGFARNGDDDGLPRNGDDGFTRESDGESSIRDGEGAPLGQSEEGAGPTRTGDSEDGPAERVQRLEERIDRIESNLDDVDRRAMAPAQETGPSGPSAGREASSAESSAFDPELVRKVIRASMDAEDVSRSEELQVIRRLLDAAGCDY
jgi:hypothetical protein